MPIIYVHGVNTRDRHHFAPIREYLRRIVAPAIAPDPDNVPIRAADWYDLCDPPKWGGISRPPTVLLGMGAASPGASGISRPPTVLLGMGAASPGADRILDAITATLPRRAAPTSGFTSGAAAAYTVRLENLPPEDLSDLIALAIRRPPEPSAAEPEPDAILRARVGAAADQVARDPEIRRRLKLAETLEAQLRIVATAVQEDVERRSSLAGQGAVGDFFRNIRDRVTESVSRVANAPGAAATVLAGELRPVLNDLVTRFLGDLLFYFTRRGTPDAPGPIPYRLLRALEAAKVDQDARGGEPIILLTHSMGGQIAYDVVTSFLPAAQSHIKVDFWCATASQVGFFEELNLFLASSHAYSKESGRRTPLVPAHLGRWWNLWDQNDILSFRTKGIFEDGIDDGAFWSGLPVTAAHGGYLERPSFYRTFAEKIQAAFPGRGS